MTTRRSFGKAIAGFAAVAAVVGGAVSTAGPAAAATPPPVPTGTFTISTFVDANNTAMRANHWFNGTGQFAVTSAPASNPSAGTQWRFVKLGQASNGDPVVRIESVRQLDGEVNKFYALDTEYYNGTFVKQGQAPGTRPVDNSGSQSWVMHYNSDNTYTFESVGFGSAGMNLTWNNALNPVWTLDKGRTDLVVKKA